MITFIMNVMPQNVSNRVIWLIVRLFLDRTASKHLRKQEREELFAMLVFEQTRLNLLNFGG